MEGSLLIIPPLALAAVFLTVYFTISPAGREVPRLHRDPILPLLPIFPERQRTSRALGIQIRNDGNAEI